MTVEALFYVPFSSVVNGRVIAQSWQPEPDDLSPACSFVIRGEDLPSNAEDVTRPTNAVVVCEDDAVVFRGFVIQRTYNAQTDLSKFWAKELIEPFSPTISGDAG